MHPHDHTERSDLDKHQIPGVEIDHTSVQICVDKTFTQKIRIIEALRMEVATKRLSDNNLFTLAQYTVEKTTTC